MNYSSEDLDRSGIYCIRNTVNCKVYIGSTGCFQRRWRQHRQGLESGRHYNKRLRAAWNKYSAAFAFEIIEFVDDLTLLLTREQYWIDFYKSYAWGSGYNVNLTAGSRAGVSLSQATKQKLREVNLGKRLTDEQKAKISLGLKNSAAVKAARVRALGYKHSMESRQKMSEGRKGRKLPPHTEETKRLLSRTIAKFYDRRYCLTDPSGNHHETDNLEGFFKENGFNNTFTNGLRRAGKYGTSYNGWTMHTFTKGVRDEPVKKIKKPFQGKPHTEESKAKISKANKGRERSPEFKQAMSTIRALTNRRIYTLKSPDGETYQTDNLFKFVRDQKLDHINPRVFLRAVREGRRHKGWSGHFVVIEDQIHIHTE